MLIIRFFLTAIQCLSKLRCNWQWSLRSFERRLRHLICWTELGIHSRTMFSSTGKRCFTIESLVGKESSLTPEDPIRPTALSYTAPADSFLNGYQSPAGRALYPNPELVFSETVNHAPLSMHPHQLGSTHLQHPHFFGTQHREPLNFYPWVLRNRFFGHRFQGMFNLRTWSDRNKICIRCAFVFTKLWSCLCYCITAFLSAVWNEMSIYALSGVRKGCCVSQHSLE